MNKKYAGAGYKGQRKNSELTEVNSILGSVLSRYGLDKKIAKYRFVTEWPSIVGPDIARRTRPETLNGTTLVVRVESSVWAQELSFHKEIILKRLSKYLDNATLVNDMQFYVGG